MTSNNKQTGIVHTTNLIIDGFSVIQKNLIFLGENSRPSLRVVVGLKLYNLFLLLLLAILLKVHEFLIGLCDKK
jgi:hypothetical protein